MHIALIGAGALGQAVKSLLAEKPVSISIWDIDPQKTDPSQTLEIIIPQANFVFFALPSWGMRQAIQSVQPLLRPTTRLVSFAKGIEEESGKTTYDLFMEIVPSHPLVVVGGPMLAEEIHEGKKAIAVIASRDSETMNTLRELMSSPRLRVETSNQPDALAVAGVLKNIYTVALGLADGLELSGNEKGWLVAQCVEEMLAIARTMHTDETIILGTGGLGDFIATGFSPSSRNRTVGYEIATKGICNLRAEGLSSLPGLMKRLGEETKHLPLLHLINAVGIVCKPAQTEFTKYFDAQEK
ncbi:MAG: NAD(P)H-dependent glycerol-3-phosphate dehydrogenase [Patescibacteria group bacterium]